MKRLMKIAKRLSDMCIVDEHSISFKCAWENGAPGIFQVIIRI